MIADMDKAKVVERRRNAKARVSVIIVTWNCRDLIGACLDWLDAAAAGCDIETIIVDNASSDSTLEILKARDDVDVLIDSGANLGFGRGNNLGVRFARGEYLFLLNPDAYVRDPTSLKTLLRAIEENGDVAAVGPKLINLDGSHQVGDAGHAPTLANVAAHQLMINKLVRGVHGYFVSSAWQLAGPPVEVDWLSGACQLVRKSVFEAVGGFPHDIFMYGEDVELGVAMRTRDWRLLYVPSTEVLHLQGATQKAGDKLYVSTRWIDSLFTTRTNGVRDNILLRFGMRTVLAVGFLLRVVLYFLKGLAGRRKPAWDKAAAMLVYARHSVSSAGRNA